MRFDTPATTNPIDQLKVVGKPTDRIDGPRKTTGTATYAHEWHNTGPSPAHGYVVGAAIAKGRIASIDLSKAKSAPGVLAVVTAENAGKLGKGSRNTAKLLGGPEIDHYHQAIAIVVAETFEQARDAAARIRVDYAPTQGRYDLKAEKESATRPPKITGGPPDSSLGDFCGRVRGSASAARRNLHDTRPSARDDGAARLHGGMERRQAHAVDLQPDDRLGRDRPGDDAWDSKRKCPHHLPLT